VLLTERVHGARVVERRVAHELSGRWEAVRRCPAGDKERPEVGNVSAKAAPARCTSEGGPHRRAIARSSMECVDTGRSKLAAVNNHVTAARLAARTAGHAEEPTRRRRVAVIARDCNRGVARPDNTGNNGCSHTRSRNSELPKYEGALEKSGALS
jgi:hypothetical protein